MYESDTCTKLAAAFIILDFCDQLLDQEKNADNKLLVSRFLVYIVIIPLQIFSAGQRVIVRDDQVSVIQALFSSSSVYTQ